MLPVPLRIFALNSCCVMMPLRLDGAGALDNDRMHLRKRTQACKLLKKRVGEVTGGRYVADEERVRFDDLVKDLKNDYQVNGNGH